MIGLGQLEAPCLVVFSLPFCNPSGKRTLAFVEQLHHANYFTCSV